MQFGEVLRGGASPLRAVPSPAVAGNGLRVLFLVSAHKPEPARPRGANWSRARAELSVVAEGVETSDQLGNLQNAGCDTAQGFLFSRPVHPDVIDALVLTPVLPDGQEAGEEAGKPVPQKPAPKRRRNRKARAGGRRRSGRRRRRGR